MKAESILVVDDEQLLRWTLSNVLTAEKYPVLEAATCAEAIEKAFNYEPDLILLDQKLPDGSGIDVLRKLHEAKNPGTVIFLTAYDRSDIAVQAMKLGAYDYLTKPVNIEELKIIVPRALEETRLRRNVTRQTFPAIGEAPASLLGSSPAMKAVFEFLAKISHSTTTTVLITGESGTGKELVARTIHAMSARQAKPLIVVNCTAIPEHLIESELFGHEKGAFTDAHSRRAGAFELADGGTVFLDEIGDMPPAFQVKLLRILEDHTFRRVGGSSDISTDVRVVAATNRDLAAQVAEGRFREDLFYRLNVAAICLPPLRDRGGDIITLAEYFLQKFNSAFRKRFRALSDETRELFIRYAWPGNIRELRNVVESAVLLHDVECLEPEHVKAEIRDQDNRSAGRAAARATSPDGAERADRVSLVELEQRAIVDALKEAKGNQSQAARLLNVSRDTLRYRIKKHGLA